MRISDWSSDVCSSDLNRRIGGLDGTGRPGLVRSGLARGGSAHVHSAPLRHARHHAAGSRSDRSLARGLQFKRGKARSGIDRKSVVSGKSVSVRVDLGGRRIIKKKKIKKQKTPK